MSLLVCHFRKHPHLVLTFKHFSFRGVALETTLTEPYLFAFGYVKQLISAKMTDYTFGNPVQASSQLHLYFSA